MILFEDGRKTESGSFIARHWRVGAGEKLRLSLVALESGDAEFSIDIDGPDADVSIGGIYLCDGDDKVNVTVNLRHNVGGSRSAQLFKGIASGHSRVRFDGLIMVAAGADKTDAGQMNGNLLLSPDAVVETSPQLEIYADDVKCSHGATVGSLNEDEQFYMRSRGITLRQARRLQMNSFLASVADSLAPELRRRISVRLDKMCSTL